MASNTTTLRSNGEKAGEFPKMLWEMLQYLEHQKRPLYEGSKEKLNDRVEWHVQVLIYTQKPNRDGVFKVHWTIQASGARSTFYAGIRDAACQAMYRVRDNCAHLLSNTRYRYFPHRRVCNNTEKKICRYNEHQVNQQHGPELIQHQIRLTKAFVAFSDDTSEELRETRFKLREREEELEGKVRELAEELEAFRGGHEAIVVAAPPPHPLPVNENEGASTSAISDALRQVQVQAQSQSRGDRRPFSTIAAPAPPERVRNSTIVTACSSKLTPTPCAPAPCGRRLRLAKGGIANENSVSSGAGGSSCIIISSACHALPQGHRDCSRPPSTQKSFAMHPVAAKPPRRDRAPASSPLEGRVRGKVLMSINSDGSLALALGKEPANAINHDDATTSSAPRSSATARRRTACCDAKQS